MDFSRAINPSSQHFKSNNPLIMTTTLTDLQAATALFLHLEKQSSVVSYTPETGALSTALVRYLTVHLNLHSASLEDQLSPPTVYTGSPPNAGKSTLTALNQEIIDSLSPQP